MPNQYLVASIPVFSAAENAPPVTPTTINPAIFSTVNLTTDERLFVGASVLSASTVHRETVLPYRTDVMLSRDIASITKVENVTTGTIYPASSYSIVGGRLNIINTIPMLPANWVNTKVAGSPFEAQSYRKDGSELRLAFDYFQQQIEVTYQASNTLKPLSKLSVLPKFVNLMANQASIGITFVGDSITLGGDSSEIIGCTPYQKPWAKLVTGWLTDKNPNVRYRNVAVGGMDASFGANQSQTDLQQKTDVLVIAYGMNDQSAQMNKATFKAHYITMMERVKAQNANVEFVLVSGFRPELTWVYSHDRWMDTYRQAAIELAAEYSAAGNKTIYVDVMAEFDRMLQRKSFVDICHNGVNHPNDFGHVLYAQTILGRLGYLAQ